MSASLGVGWKGIVLRVRGDYSTQLGFTYGADLGYTIRLPYRPKAAATAAEDGTGDRPKAGGEK